ncbi:MAG: ABC transporter ATP-binding protein, partial [Mesorhizobium sp.]
IAGQISVGTLAQFLTFMTILQMPVRQLGLMVNSFARASTCGTRLFELLDTELDIEDAPDARDLVVTDGVLRFDNVGFRYAGAGRPTLSGISFEARSGQT